METKNSKSKLAFHFLLAMLWKVLMGGESGDSEARYALWLDLADKLDF